MRLCREMGVKRQSHAEENNLQPDGFGSAEQHASGYIGELVMSKFLGVPMPEDWTWRGDHDRGYDVGGWQVRSSWSPKQGMLLKPWKDREGRYVHIVRCHQPTFWIAGWSTLAWARQHWVDGFLPHSNKPCKYLPVEWLLPFSDSRGLILEENNEAA